MRRGILRTAAGLGLLCCALAPWSTSKSALADEEVSLHAQMIRLRVESLERLHDLASWCGSGKLFACRADVYAGILELSPDDETARKWLRYERGSDGAWVQDPLYKKPRNLKRGADRYVERRNRIGDWYVERATPLREAARTRRDWRLAGSIVETAVAVAPTSEAVRTWNREIRDPDVKRRPEKAPWILEETKEARTRRRRIWETAQKARKAVPAPKNGTLSQVDTTGGIDWKHAIQGPRARIVGLPDRKELVEILRNVEATWETFDAAFGRTPGEIQSGARYGRGLTVYVTDTLDAGNQYLAAQPGTTSRELAFVGPLVGTWIKGRPAVLVKSPDYETRLECPPRQVFHATVSSYLNISSHRAWAAEGLALYLTWQVTGTRYLSSVTDVESRYGEGERPIPEYERLLAEPKADWLALGRQMLETPDKPDLLLMAGKDLNHLTKPESLYAYCIAAYLVEGLPGLCVDFLQALGTDAGKDIDGTSAEILGMNARTLEKRVYRWLVETEGVFVPR